MKGTTIRRRLASVVLMGALLVPVGAIPAQAEVTEVETGITVSGPARVSKGTPVTFSGQVTAADPRCLDGATVLVTRPTPAGQQVGRRAVVSVDSSGNFSYSKNIYRSGTWTFTYEGRTLTGETNDDVIECLPSGVEFRIRVRRS